MLYPLSAIGSHVSKSPGDITGRTSSFRTRGITAMFGCFGYELDITGLTGDEKSQISRQIDRYKELRPLFFEGDYYCLHPIGEKDRYQVLEIVSKDKQRGCIFFFQALSEANGRSLRVRLKGLSEDLCYEIRGKVYRGDALLKAGIFLPYVKQDFYAEIIAFKALPHPWT